MSRALQLHHVALGRIGAVLRVRQSSVVRQAASEPSGESVRESVRVRLSQTWRRASRVATSVARVRGIVRTVVLVHVVDVRLLEGHV